eukprot:Plantae.Rhodophyta-Purpureofilum_apyrenoidigerum.ctg7823.p1 GENE.Plantae.Rhodophyta-Purpureofilum_apyrenoidigerum.ctg7823~~Plantae.Rhodophyta-Purpureofilum_apyrenoidigerum.ctg7823.p1  ORF type:complete len:414 (-),score=66.35 Plantae.Rhodophyta-Purpureofilum_apyrenoidigerum.ctg7823:148-1389(-)
MEEETSSSPGAEPLGAAINEGRDRRDLTKSPSNVESLFYEEKPQTIRERFDLPSYSRDESFRQDDGLNAPIRASVCLFSEDCIDHVEVADLNQYLEISSEVRRETGKHMWAHVQGRRRSQRAAKYLEQAFGLHEVAAEAIQRPPQRAKILVQEEVFFLLTHVPEKYQEQRSYVDVRTNQLSLVVVPRHRLCVTLQDANDAADDKSPLFDKVLERIKGNVDGIRAHSTMYLLLVVTRTVISNYFPLLEYYGDRLEDLETWLMSGESRRDVAKAISRIKRDMSKLRRAVWPMRECLADMLIMSNALCDPEEKNFVQELYEHLTYLTDIMETYRDLSGGLIDLYLSAQDHRSQEVMKFLAVIGSVFIPFTFLTGIYGMNFAHMPEYRHHISYIAFWVTVIGISIYLVSNFRRWGWA